MPKSNIAIVNAGGSNISSLTFALDRIKASYITTNQASQIEDSSHIILPGVGAANDAMDKLRKSNLIEVIRNLKTTDTWYLFRNATFTRSFDGE